MKLKFCGSGIRKSEIELTDCELKDLSFALNELREGFSRGQTGATYGCVGISIKEQPRVPYQINQEVLTAVHEERVFQNRKWGTIQEHGHEVGSWLTIMRKLLNDADQAWSSNRGDIGALDEIRKVVAVGIACMEQCGVIRRSPMAFVALQGGHVPHSVEGE